MGQEVAVAIVDNVRRRAILELEERRIVPDDGPNLGPLASDGPDALYPAATQQPDRIDLVWALAIRNATALRWIQLVRCPGPQQPVRVRPDVDGAHVSDFTRLND